MVHIQFACTSPSLRLSSSIFFFNDTATTEIYTLSLHDALPICLRCRCRHIHRQAVRLQLRGAPYVHTISLDRKSTRLNSSHQIISYAVFCLKKKKDRKTSSTRETLSSSILLRK